MLAGLFVPLPVRRRRVPARPSIGPTAPPRRERRPVGRCEKTRDAGDGAVQTTQTAGAIARCGTPPQGAEVANAVRDTADQ